MRVVPALIIHPSAAVAQSGASMSLSASSAVSVRDSAIVHVLSPAYEQDTALPMTVVQTARSAEPQRRTRPPLVRRGEPINQGLLYAAAGVAALAAGSMHISPLVGLAAGAAGEYLRQRYRFRR